MLKSALQYIDLNATFHIEWFALVCILLVMTLNTLFVMFGAVSLRCAKYQYPAGLWYFGVTQGNRQSWGLIIFIVYQFCRSRSIKNDKRPARINYNIIKTSPLIALYSWHHLSCNKRWHAIASNVKWWLYVAYLHLTISQGIDYASFISLANAFYAINHNLLMLFGRFILVPCHQHQR